MAAASAVKASSAASSNAWFFAEVRRVEEARRGGTERLRWVR